MTLDCYILKVIIINSRAQRDIVNNLQLWDKMALLKLNTKEGMKRGKSEQRIDGTNRRVTAQW